MINFLVYSCHPIKNRALGDRGKAFQPTYVSSSVWPVDTLFLCFGRIQRKDGWNLLLMDPNGEISIGSSYHFSLCRKNAKEQCPRLSYGEIDFVS